MKRSDLSRGTLKSSRSSVTTTVTGLKVRDTLTKKIASCEVTGVFVAIGHVAEHHPRHRPWCDLQRRVRAPRAWLVHQTIGGSFAAGDVHGRRLRQAVTSAGSGLYRGDRRRAMADAGNVELGPKVVDATPTRRHLDGRSMSETNITTLTDGDVAPLGHR